MSQPEGSKHKGDAIDRNDAVHFEKIEEHSGPIPGNASLAGDSGDASVSDFLVAKESSTRLDSWIDWISDFCSSILVKETRQAIKSRQFFMTFMFLLALIVLWTFFALSPARDNYEIESLGSFMLCGFLWILGVPLVLIIPFTTFRSLAQEYEDGTIDMVMITTMKPWQIIAGKLGSAMLQVLIYMSILAPCISFCYLLRGVDISQIWYSIGGSLVVTFGLCCLAIALASAADTARIIQVLSVLLILALLFCGFVWCGLSYAICFEPVSQSDQGIMNLLWSGAGLAWISSALVLFCAATARIAFASSNRSTLVRIGVTIQVVLFVGWVIASMTAFGYNKYGFMVASVFAMHYMLLVGGMMLGCHPGMSPRVRRSLPRTRLKQLLFGLYMPGPGRAFLFVIGLSAGICSTLAILAIGHDLFEVSFDMDIPNAARNPNTFAGVDIQFSLLTILANFLFFLFFFCIAFLISRLFARRSVHRNPFVIEMAFITAIPAAIAIFSSYALAPDVFEDLRYGFDLSQIFNWYRVQYLAVEGNVDEAIPYMLIVGIPTFTMLYVCFRLSAPELSESHTAVPQRVLEENEALKRERLWGADADEETIDEIFAVVRSN
ncbi:ABC transporter permease [Mariniblastus fucicola]|uniref:ABC-2 family transporter protein n=1 Tax=Mariniblastus fucicola TaxID=980251 RepID=A0A5B9PIX3_9BACT|nr:hypothetical protein [Mariniblastus fucicola]QEG22701.1 ABC-2 family transporter protein [Mariniblastus fucicola]